MRDGHVALGDGDEAREARFGGQEVVGAAVEAAVRDAVADREELAGRVEEEAELHGLEELGGGAARRARRRPASARAAAAERARLSMSASMRAIGAARRVGGPRGGRRRGRRSARPSRRGTARADRPGWAVTRRAGSSALATSGGASAVSAQGSSVATSRAWLASGGARPPRPRPGAPAPRRRARPPASRAMSTRVSACAASAADAGGARPPGCRRRRASAARQAPRRASASWRTVTVWLRRLVARARRRPRATSGARRRCPRATPRTRAADRRPASRQALREREQMAGEVAAVHGRDVARLERAQLARVVPVVEVAAEALQARQRRERRLEPLHRVEEAEPAEVAGRDHRQQIEPDVGGRRAVRDDRPRVLLEVVGRQEGGPRPDEGLEEAPGPARGRAEDGRSSAESGSLAATARAAADPPGDRGREAQSRRKGAATARLLGRSRTTRAPRGRGEDERPAHAPVDAGMSRARSDLAWAAVTHSSSRRRVTNRRTRVRPIASLMSHAWWARKVMASVIWAAASVKVGPTPRRWLRLEMPAALRDELGEHGEEGRQRDAWRARTWSTRAGGACGSSQPATRVSKAAGADRVRRRLSSIFQRPTSGIQVGRGRRADAPRSIQGRSCQSPRAQRCWRAAATS